MGHSWFTAASAHVKPEDCQKYVDYVVITPILSTDESCEPNKNNPVQRENYQLGPKTWSQKRHGGLEMQLLKTVVAESLLNAATKSHYLSTIIIHVPLKTDVKYGTLLDIGAN